MKTRKVLFLLEFLATIVFLFLFVFGMEYLYKNEITRIDLLYSSIYNSDNNIELAIVGNSHAGAMGCTPFVQTDKIGNYSVGGQDLFHASLVISEVLARKKKLKYLVLFVDYDLMGYSLVTTNQRYTDREYYKYSDTMQDMSLGNRIMAQLNFFRNNRDLSRLKNRFTNSEIPSVKTENLNFIPIVEGRDDNSLCEMRAKEMTSVKFNKKLLPENEKILSEILEKVAKNNVKLIVVVPPKRECFYRYANKLNTQIAKKSLYKVVYSCENVSFIDLYEDMSFADDDFIDPDHANSKGVDKIVINISKYMQ